MQEIDKIGEVKYNNFGSRMKVVGFRKYSDVDIYFEDYNWTRYNVQYNKFISGQLKCPYEPRIYGVGYIGEGKHDTRENGKMTKCYKVWQSMLQRCYDIKYKNKKNTYKDVIVCKEWLCFQNFAEWYEENYYEVEDEIMALDKDILIKGNKIYSPQTCVFVPNRINSLFTKADINRGEYPIGINYREKCDKLYVSCNDCNGKKKHLGVFKPNQVEEAFQCYKQYKEKIIKQVADDYYSQGLIPKKLYDAMYRYKVEITD